VDPGLPGVQGKTKRVKSPELVALLQEFSRDKLALRERHITGAERVANYDFNNTYQYIINREDQQVSWLGDALEELASALSEAAPSLDVPSEGKGDARQHAIVADDAKQEQAFIAKWRPRVSAMTHARNRKMLEVILGESVEHLRFFDQMLTGRDDLLGRRTGGESTGGGVLPVRWINQ
jgi:hypothetical protein